MRRLRPATVGLIGKVVELATLALLLTLVPRALGPHDYGSFALALSVVTLASTSLALGGPTLMSRFLPGLPEQERRAVVRALAARSALARGVLLGAGGAVALAISFARPAVLPLWSTAVVLGAVLADTAATLVLQVGLGLGGVAPWSIRYPLQNAVLVAAALALHRGFGLPGALAALPLASIAALALGAVSTRGAWGPRGVPLPPGASRFAAVQAASGALVQLLHRGPVLAVALLAGRDREQTGYAALAVGVALALTYVVWQTFAVELPGLAARAVGDRSAAEAQVRSFAARALVVAVPVAALALLGSGTLLRASAGRSFGHAETALAVALAAVPLAPALAALNQGAALRLVPGRRLAAHAAGAAAFLAAAAALVPSHEAAGAAVALVVGSAVSVLAAARLLPAAVTARLAGASFLASALLLMVARWR